jgi:membrane-associated phospholipid phosphatase
MDGRGLRSWLAEAEQVDRAIYAAVAGTSTPQLDRAMRRLARAADYSRLSIAASAVLAIVGGRSGRRAAGSGLASLAATSAFVNVIVKPLGRRHRPERTAEGVVQARQIAMPSSRSFPSGHTAAAVAFASGAGRALPIASVPLHALAAAVGYSRVHTGVHYPGDVVAGALIGSIIADLTSAAPAALRRRRKAD